MRASSGFEVVLSSKGLAEAMLYDKDRFVFVFGNVEHKLSRFQACFFSGKVRRLVSSDVTAERISVNVEGDSSLFDDVVELMNGRSVTVNGRNADFLLRVCVDLDNVDLFDAIFDSEIMRGTISVANAVSRLRMKKDAGRSMDEEVEFIALHFDEVVEELGSLSDDDIDEILGNGSLKLVDEESLLAFVVSRRNDETGALPFLRHIRPEFLPEDSIHEYLQCAQESGLWDVWDVLCKCVCGFNSACRGREAELFPGRYVKSERDRIAREELERQNRERLQDNITRYRNQPFDGIIDYFGSKCGGNVHEKGIVNITASSTNHGQPSLVADRNSGGYWYSSNKPGQYIMFDFKDNAVCLSHYTLKCNAGAFPVKWELAGSNDETLWVEVSKQDTKVLTDKQVHSFTCDSNGKSFRFVRLFQTGNDNSGGNFLLLSEVEFFGTVRPL